MFGILYRLPSDLKTDEGFILMVCPGATRTELYEMIARDNGLVDAKTVDLSNWTADVKVRQIMTI